jgi:hypothetical protein
MRKGPIKYWENLKNDPPNFRIYKNDPVLDGPATFFAFCRAHLELCIKSWIHIKDCIETYLDTVRIIDFDENWTSYYFSSDMALTSDFIWRRSFL